MSSHTEDYEPFRGLRKVEPARTAQVMTERLERLLSDAMEIEDWPYYVDRIGTQQIQLRGIRDNERYAITVVKKRA